MIAIPTKLFTLKPFNADKNEQRINNGRKSPYIIAQRNAGSRTSIPDHMNTVRGMFDYTRCVYILEIRMIQKAKCL